MNAASMATSVHENIISGDSYLDECYP
uniref:Uncharacterized protein n=1 Tax=Arundo donax TaxID=35708 RepID=A0A0A9C1M7_ARUDO